jgi:radical SAM protein with 4Fe4S-binding SPASM domain
MEAPASPLTSVRSLSADDVARAVPVHAVWEVTLRCDQACGHCGSRAGKARPVELDTAQCLDVARSMIRLGCREVSLIGGEAYLRDDLEEIIAFLANAGIRVTMQTGGRTLTTTRARSLKAAGMSAVGVSVDGNEATHDLLRGSKGSYAAAIRALDACWAAGLVVACNTQANKLTLPVLEETCHELRRHGIQAWKVQVTVPMGRAADHPEWILEPWQIVTVMDSLGALQKQAIADCAPGDIPFAIYPGNTLGYYGPHELALRSRPGGYESHWIGCRAGINVVSVESDGTVKGCPSLPTAPYAAGNVSDLSLEEIWQHSETIRFARDRELEELWGHCKTCYYAETCRGGCSWMTHCALGRRGNNPFCYHRVKTLEKRGIRERLVVRERAPNKPYDFGRFDLEEYDMHAPPVPPARHRLPILD